MLAQADQFEFIAPAVYLFEVYNVLLGLHRRGSLNLSALGDAREALDDLQVGLAPPIPTHAFPQLVEDARLLRLSVFDACYFQLAMAEDCAIATRDSGLLAACDRAGVPTFDLRG